MSSRAEAQRYRESVLSPVQLPSQPGFVLSLNASFSAVRFYTQLRPRSRPYHLPSSAPPTYLPSLASRACIRYLPRTFRTLISVLDLSGDGVLVVASGVWMHLRIWNLMNPGLGYDLRWQWMLEHSARKITVGILSGAEVRQLESDRFYRFRATGEVRYHPKADEDVS